MDWGIQTSAKECFESLQLYDTLMVQDHGKNESWRLLEVERTEGWVREAEMTFWEWNYAVCYYHGGDMSSNHIYNQWSAGLQKQTLMQTMDLENKDVSRQTGWQSKVKTIGQEGSNIVFV